MVAVNGSPHLLASHRIRNVDHAVVLKHRLDALITVINVEPRAPNMSGPAGRTVVALDSRHSNPFMTCIQPLRACYTADGLIVIVNPLPTFAAIACTDHLLIGITPEGVNTCTPRIS